jgi:hypothetical protein
LQSPRNRHVGMQLWSQRSPWLKFQSRQWERSYKKWWDSLQARKITRRTQPFSCNWVCQWESSLSLQFHIKYFRVYLIAGIKNTDTFFNFWGLFCHLSWILGLQLHFSIHLGYNFLCILFRNFNNLSLNSSGVLLI